MADPLRPLLVYVTTSLHSASSVMTFTTPQVSTVSAGLPDAAAVGARPWGSTVTDTGMPWMLNTIWIPGAIHYKWVPDRVGKLV